MNIPETVAIIMDGNGRWAKQRGLPRTAGHKKGADQVRTIALEANRLGIKKLILYAFSTENWKRPEDEVSYLCKLPGLFFSKFINELMEKNIRVTFKKSFARQSIVLEKIQVSNYVWRSIMERDAKFFWRCKNTPNKLIQD